MTKTGKTVFATFIFFGGIVTVSIIAMVSFNTYVDNRVKAGATSIVNADREQFKKDAIGAASAAATLAADKAIRDTVTPVVTEVKIYMATDSQQDKYVQQQLEELKSLIKQK